MSHFPDASTTGNGPLYTHPAVTVNGMPDEFVGGVRGDFGIRTPAANRRVIEKLEDVYREAVDLGARRLVATHGHDQANSKRHLVQTFHAVLVTYLGWKGVPGKRRYLNQERNDWRVIARMLQDLHKPQDAEQAAKLAIVANPQKAKSSRDPVRNCQLTSAIKNQLMNWKLDTGVNLNAWILANYRSRNLI